MVAGGDIGSRNGAEHAACDSPPVPDRALWAGAPAGISSIDASSALPADASVAPLRDPVFHIPVYWILIAPAMVMWLLPAIAAARTLPGLTTIAAGLAAILLGALSRVFMRLERERATGPVQRALVMLVAIGLPLALYGLAGALWAQEHGEPLWIGAVGMAALASAAASLLLVRRPPAMLTALVAAWLPLAGFSGNLTIWLLFAFGATGCALLVVRQTRIIDASMAQQRQQLRVQQRAFDILVDYEKTGQGWFWETDTQGRITYLSSSLGAVFGCAMDDLLGRRFVELFGLNVTGHESAAAGLNLHFSAQTGFRDILVSVAEAGGEHWWSISGSPIRDRAGAYCGFRGFGWDQTEKRRTQERTSRLAHYDSLTGAANRLQMTQWLETILNAPQKDSRHCAVLLIDLDRFKQVNDTLGHPVGDAVLKQAAERLRCVVDGAGQVGRLGGDEFQVILPGRQGREALATLAGRIVTSLAEPYEIDGQRANIGASAGIAQAPEDGVTSEALIRNADLALYAAKDAGRGCYRFYIPDLHSDAEERRQLEADLRDAVAGGGLELWYQPVIHNPSETISGFEALLRWTHPLLGPISPAKFVPIAEDAGLIAQIGEWALRTACKDLAKWPDTVRVSVNLSSLQFANPALPAIVTSALASAQVAPSRLELEITESVFLNEDSSTEAKFAALKRIGVRLALDDFGTGYSSIGYLEAAPFDRIKIDQSFLRGAIEPGSRNGAILASIVALAEALGMETTAEGVETQDELELARILGCSHVQGYIYEAPMSAADTLTRLAAGLSATASGTRATRPPRNVATRKVAFEIDGERHEGVVRNIAISGAMIEGPRNIAPGTVVALAIGEDYDVSATVRWCDGNRIGVEFAAPVTLDKPRRIFASALAAIGGGVPEDIRRAG